MRRRPWGLFEYIGTGATCDDAQHDDDDDYYFFFFRALSQISQELRQNAKTKTEMTPGAESFLKFEYYRFLSAYENNSEGSFLIATAS